MKIKSSFHKHRKKLKDQKNRKHYTFIFFSKSNPKYLSFHLSKFFPYYLLATLLALACVQYFFINNYISLLKTSQEYEMFQHKYISLKESYNSMVAKASQELLENQEGYENLCTRLVYEKEGALGPFECKRPDVTELDFEDKRLREFIANIPDLIPLRGSFTSTFGWRPNPINGKPRMHHGIDIAARVGSAIRASADGLVMKIAQTHDYGKFIEVNHGNGIVTRYAHTKNILVKEKERVQKGMIIGTVGMTGRTTGPHLHYEIIINGTRVDPANFMVW